MKNKVSKFGLIFTIICNICIVLCFIIGFILLFKFEFPEKIDKKDFIKYMKNKGCSLIDLQDTEKDERIDVYLVTTKDSCPYLISYTVFNDSNARNSFFEELKYDVLNRNANVVNTFSIRINLFSEYYEYHTRGDYYKIVTLNKNSILYAAANKEYKNDILNIFRDFNYLYEPNWSGLKVVCFSMFFILIIAIVSLWKIENKIRNKGWVSIVPFYNLGCLSKDILGSPWYAFLLIIPFINMAIIIIFLYSLGRIFNKNDLGCILLILLPSIALPLLAFDDSKYDVSKMVLKINKKEMKNG